MLKYLGRRHWPSLAWAKMDVNVIGYKDEAKTLSFETGFESRQ